MVCRGAGLDALWQTGGYAPPEREDYVQAVVRAFVRLWPGICVQRLVADPAPGDLIAPAWAADKNATLSGIRSELARQNTWQGKDGFCPDTLPDWENPPGRNTSSNLGKPPRRGADAGERS